MPRPKVLQCRENMQKVGGLLLDYLPIVLHAVGLCTAGYNQRWALAPQ